MVDLEHVECKKIFLDVEKVFTLAYQPFKVVRVEEHVHTDVALRDRVLDGCLDVTVIEGMFHYV